MVRRLLLFSILAIRCLAFDPPTLSARLEALGPLDNESAVMRNLLAFDDNFPPMGVAQFGDWLETHPEPGQTFKAYAASGFNRPTAQRRIIYLLPIGDFPDDNSPVLEDLKAYAEAYFQPDVALLPPVPASHPKFHTRTNPFTHKPQLLTGSILSYLKGQLPGDAYCLLGITMADLYPGPDWNYVFGQASLAERVGVYSFARYDPQFFGLKRTSDYRQLILKRSCKVLAHETGHMFGLNHCIYFECLMNGANNLNEADREPCYLCPICLRKLHHNVQFDPLARYEELARFYRSHHWDDELAWVERQLEKAKEP